MPLNAPTPALRKTAHKAIELCVEVQYLQIEWHDEKYGERCETVATTLKNTWQRLTLLVDRLVYAAGGHRDGSTWHLCGASLTAQALWDQTYADGEPPIGDQMDDTNLEMFLFGQYGRSEGTYTPLWDADNLVPPTLPPLAVIPDIALIDEAVAQMVSDREHSEQAAYLHFLFEADEEYA